MMCTVLFLSQPITTLEDAPMAYFKESLQLQRNENFLTSEIFFSHFLHFLRFEVQVAQVQLQRQFLLTFSRFSPLFFTFFHSCSSKFTTTVQLHNCHFTTANYILQLQKLSSVAR